MVQHSQSNQSRWREDPRYRIARREAWIGVGLALANFIWWYSFAYGLGSKPVEEYQYIFGLPQWFFYSCIGGLLLFIPLVALVVRFFFRELPLEANPEKEEEEGREST